MNVTERARETGRDGAAWGGREQWRTYVRERDVTRRKVVNERVRSEREREREGKRDRGVHLWVLVLMDLLRSNYRSSYSTSILGFLM